MSPVFAGTNSPGYWTLHQLSWLLIDSARTQRRNVTGLLIDSAFRMHTPAALVSCTLQQHSPAALVSSIRQLHSPAALTKTDDYNTPLPPANNGHKGRNLFACLLHLIKLADNSSAASVDPRPNQVLVPALRQH